MQADKWSDYEFFLKTSFFIRGQSLQKSTTFSFLRFLVIIYNSYLEPYKSFKKSYHRASYL